MAPPARIESGGGIDGGGKTAEYVSETAAEKAPAKLVTALAFSSSTHLLMTEAAAWLQLRQGAAAIPRLQGRDGGGPGHAINGTRGRRLPRLLRAARDRSAHPDGALGFATWTGSAHGGFATWTGSAHGGSPPIWAQEIVAS